MKQSFREPSSLHPEHTNYARRVWYRPFELTPGVTLSATARLRPELQPAAGKNSGELLAALCRAASGALALHPTVNFYTFWGKMRPGDDPPRVGVVLEGPDGVCSVAGVTAAHQKSQSQVAAEILEARKQAQAFQAQVFQFSLRNRLPLPLYLAERLTGHYASRYMRLNPPLIIDYLDLPGIEGVSFAPAHSMALYPVPREDGSLKLTLCFNHQLGNPRPLGRFLLTICELLGE